LIVQRPVLDDFRTALLDAANGLRVGDPFVPQTQMGPVISQAQLDRVLAYIASGSEEGATVLAGGSRLDRAGYFLAPTVFVDTNTSMRIVREEIFGPVVALSSFEDEEEAIAMANDTDYGLAATMWTENAARSHRVAAQLRAGTVWINTFGVMDVAVPFGGYKTSGLGREQGLESVESFSEVKSVYLGL
jgi:aldehyde dehydrogenase (NAD+)/phenylacetaldehyde dehydrogenase